MNRWIQIYAHFPSAVSRCLSLTEPQRGICYAFVATILCVTNGLQPLHAIEFIPPTSLNSAGSVMDLSLDQPLDMNMDKVYGASMHEHTVSQSPSTASLAMRDEIQEKDFLTLANVLREVHGEERTTERPLHLILNYHHKVADTGGFFGRVTCGLSSFQGKYLFGVVLRSVVDKNNVSVELEGENWQINWRVVERYTLKVGDDGFKDQLRMT